MNPYRIDGPALISFSGGRTSGYMLWHILDAHGGKLPDDVHVAFANTGKEREETLRFVHECASRWGVRVRWLEFVTDRKRGGPASQFAEVGYNSASRAGEPLDRLIGLRNAIFSTISGRWCTQSAKVETLMAFMKAQGLKEGEFTEVLGFRADERDRVFETPLRPKNIGRTFRFPLATAGVRKDDVNRWWDAQPFNLELRKGTGNCDHCPFVSDKARIARARLNPEGMDWWERHEADKDFVFGRMSFAEIRRHISRTPLLALDDIEADAADSECAGWCPTGAAA